MTLKDYLDGNGISMSDFAKKCGVNRSLVWNVYTRKRSTRFSVQTAYRFIVGSEFKLRLVDLMTKEETTQIKQEVDV